MTSYVIGIKVPNDKWKKMKEVYEACIEAGVTIPDVVDKFFNSEVPDDAGVVIDLRKSNSVKEWKADMQDGFVVDLEQLRLDYPGVTHIRFYNSY